MFRRISGGSVFSRRPTRIFSLIVLGLLAWLWPAAWRYVLPALSPHVAVCSAVSLRLATMILLMSAPMLVVMVLHHRFWCRNLCPVGMIADTCGRVHQKHRAANDKQQSTQRGLRRYVL